MLIFLISLLIIFFILISVYKRQINFFISGLDAGFSFSDLMLLWKVSTLCELENPLSLFYSDESLKRCMEYVSSIASSDDSARMQLILSKLFQYKTKLQNESDDKRNLESTKSLDVGQKLRIIFPGKGVFTSEILANGSELIISVPKQMPPSNNLESGNDIFTINLHSFSYYYVLLSIIPFTFVVVL